MKDAARAGAVLGGSSLVAIVAGVVTTKVAAVVLKPEDFGLWMLLKNSVALALVPATFGIGAGLVQFGARALGEGDEPLLAALYRAATWLRLGCGATVVLGIAVFRAPLSRVLLGGDEHSNALLVADLALALSLAFDLDVSILNTFHRVRALAFLSTLNALISAAVVISILVALGSGGIAPSIVGSALAGWVLSRLIVRWKLGGRMVRSARCEVKNVARQLIRFGGPYTTSLIAVAGAQLIAPAIILHMAGAREVAFYQAAALIGANYLGFIIVAVEQDYFPRIAAKARSPEALVAMVNEQQRLVLITVVPAILAVLALAPYAIPLLYSNAFHPAVAVLDWQVIGDVFRFSSWTLAFVVLVRRGSLVYFLTEAVWGTVFLATGSLLMPHFGITGFGFAYCLSYAVYNLTVWLVVRRDIGMVWARETLLAMIGAVSLLVVAGAAVAEAPGGYRLAITLLCSAVALAVSIRTIVRLWRPAGLRRDGASS